MYVCRLRAPHQSAGENKRILRIIKEHFAKLQVFIWAPFKLGGQDDEDDGMSSDSSGFSVGSCTEEEEFSLDKTELYARAMFDRSEEHTSELQSP